MDASACMLTASTPDLQLGMAYLGSDPRGRVHAAFPINCFTGAEHTATGDETLNVVGFFCH